MGHFHPESPARLAAIEDQIIASGLDQALRRYCAPMAERAHLLRVHDVAYVEELFSLHPAQGHSVQLDVDTSLGHHSLDAARRAAGAAVLGTDLILGDETDTVFCAVRPPGHHAERNRSMGFCIFNNVAVGVAHALEAHGLERVAVLDFDVHHGNGTEHIFQRDSRVMCCSTFQHPFYPFSGDEDSGPLQINVPLKAGDGGAAFSAAVEQRWLPALEAFRPQMLFVSAGFDAHREDDMGGLNLVEADYAWVTQEIKALALRHARGRILSTLEGGYALPALGRSVVAHLRALLR